ncbi:MAG: GNAT family N-acetyltransferase [Pseudomonadota bacterium]
MLTLRAARPDDLRILREWERAPHVAAAGIADWPWDEMLASSVPWSEILIAEVNGRPMGVVQILDPAADPDAYWGACGPGLRAVDIWIGEAAYLRRGHGREMMRQAMERCFAEPLVEAILIDPLATNTDAHRFYEALGFRFEEARRFDDDLCHVYRLTRQQWREGT